MFRSFVHPFMITIFKKSYYFILSLPIYFISFQANAQQKSFISSITAQNQWMDSVYDKMSLRQRVAQMIFVRAHTNRGQAYSDSVGQVIKNEHLGGVVFFQGGPGRQLNLSNTYQKLSDVPLLIAMDGEWGLGMRLDSTLSFPYQMTLGAIRDNNLIYKMGQEVARQFKRLGMHINFAPDMDVNNNPANPVINYRSFGDDKVNVAQKGIAYMQGMQSEGLITTAKHFPGHGDTNVDSHQDLPQLPFTRQRLDSLEEYPFKQAIAAGISGVMVAHMNIPALDPTPKLPSTLSRPIITGLLKDSLGFKGLVVSDAMEMKGVVKYFPNGEADVKAFIAGNDILELSENSKRADKLIRKAIHKGLVSEQEFEARVKKILAAKYWAGLNHYQPANPENFSQEINTPEAKQLIQTLADAAVTLLKGDSLINAFDPAKSTAIISIGADVLTPFQQELGHYFTNSKVMMVPKDMQVPMMRAFMNGLKEYQQIIVSTHDSRLRPGSKLDYSSNLKLFIAELAAMPNTAISVFANPYTIAGLPGIEKAGALIVGYQKDDFMQRAAAKVLSKQLKPSGKLPVTINTFFTTGMGL
ncbi:glycoside hydrolase family 3 [Mucilaginibacter sp. RS28]|uniref:beta-N-acetylhexosaminidase n=1 Tax=Mucilaginibacter straminoryzae TaxID=2932774 RepID=A0A9X2B874_9SPHI|nr:glycoside hydrolase family 3 N-terminal domain-containing protein [Mucilaginibacter straminoryzae]MCJ8208425.1 glycoside hydrolase family 3 [Mucilaginibacter straminoryzae]